MANLDSIRNALEKLKLLLAEDRIDEDSYARRRELILGDLTPSERSEVEGTPTPRPASGASFGPSGGRTRVPSLAELDLVTGTVLLNQWRIVRELGRGGFGTVFEAEDIKLDRTLALKVLDPSMAAREELLARFRREVTLMRELAHERIVRVYDYREDASQHLALISMEYVRGCSVKDVLDRARSEKSRVPVELALAIFQQTLEALSAAHARNVIHRDVTPGNILLAGGTAAELLVDPERNPRVKLVDFGIAGLVERTELSAKSRVLGTAAYVAPEVLDPDAVITAGADVFGAGAVVYDLLTGKTPMVTGYRPVAGLRADIPAGCGGVIDAAVRPGPEERPSAAAALGTLEEAKADAERAEQQLRRLEELRGKLTAALARGDQVVVERSAESLRGELGAASADDGDLERAERWLAEVRRNREEAERRREAAERRKREEAQYERGREAARRQVEELQRRSEAGAGSTGRSPAPSVVAGGDGSGAGGAKRSSQGPSVKPMVVGIVVVALVVVLVGIWLKSSRGRVPTQPAGPTAVPTAAGGVKSAVLVIRSNVAGDVAWLDGEPLGPTPQELEVSPGQHLVRVTKEGCTAQELWVEAGSGDRESAMFELECATPVPPTLTPVPTKTPTRTPMPVPRAGTQWTEAAIGIKFRYIPAGSFEMGSPPSEPDRSSDERQHRVTITRGYWMGETEVTQGQWRTVMGTSPSNYFPSCGDNCPVDGFTWFDAVEFANRLSRKAGFPECYRISGESVSFVGLGCGGYRLPTEAEWEYSARSGASHRYAGGDDLDAVGWYRDNSNMQPHPVGQKRANGWGLQDMSGNIWEWVWDWYGDYPSGSVTDSIGASAGSDRVARGGYYGSFAWDCRPASRGKSPPGYRTFNNGFRLVRTAE